LKKEATTMRKEREEELQDELMQLQLLVSKTSRNGGGLCDPKISMLQFVS
jgi:hypothetical protein